MTLVSDGIQSMTAGLVSTRDKNQSVYHEVPFMTRGQLSAIYRTSLGGRVVDQRAEDSFRKWREWQAKAGEISILERREKSLKIKQLLENCQKRANLYGTAYVLINLDDNMPEEPVDYSRLKAGCIKSLTVLEDGDIAPGPNGLDILSEFYDKPEYYEILTMNGDNVTRIHPDRVVVMHGVERIDAVSGDRGDSVLQRGLTALQNNDATMANVASLIWEAKVDVLSIKGLSDAMRDPENEKLIKDRLNAAMHAKGNNGALILDAEGEEFEQKTISFATLPDIIEKFEIAFCAAFGYPRSMLFDDQEGGLGNNGKAGLEKYYNSVSSDQENVIEPAITVLDECLIIDALGTRPDDLWYKWRPLWNMSDKEIAEIGKITTESFTMAYEKGIVSVEVANKAWVNRMTEIGAAPGLEALQGEFNGDLGEDRVTSDPDLVQSE